MSQICWHCSAVLIKGKASCMTAKLLRISSHNVASALNMMYGFNIETSDTFKMYMMCRTCHSKLSTLTKYYSDFLGTSDWKSKFQTQPSSIVSDVKPDVSKILSTGSVSENEGLSLSGTPIPPFIPVPTVPKQETTIPSSNVTPKRKASPSPVTLRKKRSHNALKSTPLRTTLSNSESTKEGRSTVCKYICDRIRRQMKNFQKETCLQNQVLASDDIKLWPMLTSELLSKASFVLRVLEAIAGDAWRPDHDTGCITPSVGVAFAILLKQRKKHCTRFQKLVSLVLSATMASKETYRILNNMNICTSYESTNVLLAELSKNSDVKMLSYNLFRSTVIEKGKRSNDQK